MIRRSYYVITANSDGWWYAQCSPGERAVGGGGRFQDVLPGDANILSVPTNAQLNTLDGVAPVAWLVYEHNGSAVDRTLFVGVVCVPS